ncbi:RING-H2 finger protein ATL2-like [Cicer arietinum]|uniref:RING-type E3 ubiquitin transferase n=1 Tax=Cicer arietinum TaxID=3827 RepID=A0A1S3DY73_CICAR|nr:RING-H2 finger protein ATL63-like [Cicer arietinum]
MLNQLNSLNSSTNSLSQLTQNMFSDNNKNNIIMLTAIVSLLLVILFVLLLHVYAKLFLFQPNSQSRARRRQAPATISDLPIPSSFHHFNIETPQPISTKGLDFTVVSTIPTFVSDEKTEELECVICLSCIEEGEIGRKLPKCGHVFHVECIDMWLNSHCNCPICRDSIVDVGVIEIVIDTPSYESGSVSVTETSLSLFGFNFKRMISKVFMSSNVHELDASQ